MFILGLKYWFKSGLNQHNNGLRECCSSPVMSALQKTTNFHCPPLDSHRTYSTHSPTHFNVTTLRSPSGLPQADFNGLHFKAELYCTKVIIDRAENKCTTCVLCFFFLLTG